MNSLPPTLQWTPSAKDVVLISTSELESVQSVLSSKFTLRHVSGAGHKLLGICGGRAEAYVLTKSSNFKWDCCGPHAILLSLGGGIVKFEDLYNCAKTSQNEFSSLSQIKYHEPDDAAVTGAARWCNRKGVVAYRHPQTLANIAQVVKKLEF